MSWYKVILTEEQVATGEHRNLQDQFSQIYADSGSPQGVVLLADRWAFGPRGRRGSYPLYFSPAAVSYCGPLITNYSGERCEVAYSTDVTFLAGERSAWLM
jgi:hypothetical protein